MVAEEAAHDPQEPADEPGQDQGAGVIGRTTRSITGFLTGRVGTPGTRTPRAQSSAAGQAAAAAGPMTFDELAAGFPVRAALSREGSIGQPTPTASEGSAANLGTRSSDLALGRVVKVTALAVTDVKGTCRSSASAVLHDRCTCVLRASSSLLNTQQIMKQCSTHACLMCFAVHVHVPR